MPILLRPLSERSHLPTRLADLGRARKLALILAGAFVFLAVGVAGVTLACTLDAAFHLPVVVRAMLLVVLLGLGGPFFYRGIWGPSRLSVHPRHVAHLLESRYPKLNDSLASAIEFLTGTPSEHTSARFRRVAVMRAQRGFDRCDPRQLVPSGQAWRSFFLATAAVGVAGAFGFASPDVSSRAVLRLLDPFGTHPWPTKTQIQLTSPTPVDFPVRAAIGEPFDLSFTLRGIIPDVAVVNIELENGNKSEEVIAITPTEAEQKRVDLKARLEPHRIPRTFRFQIRANDAETPLYSVTLAPPPKLVPLDGRQPPQMHVTYPAYTDLPATDLPDGVSVIEATHGTRIRFSAATDRRVVSAVLVPQVDRTLMRQAAALAMVADQNGLTALGTQLLADDVTADIPVTVSGSDGTRLSAEFTPKLSGVYALRFTDETGLTGTRLLDLHVVPDPAPLVVLERPALGKDPVLLLPTSAVSIQARAEDRSFAVRRLFLEYRVGGPDAPLRELPLVDLPAFGLPLSGLTGPAVAFTQEKQLTVSAATVLPVSLFTKPDGTPPVDGDRIILRAAAFDYDDVSVLKEPGRSKEEVTLVIVGKPALDTMLQQEVSKLRKPLLNAREQQRQIRERTEELAKAAADNKLTAEEAAKLGQAERDQRAVRNELSDPRDGMQRAAQLLKDTIRANNLPRSATTDRIDAVADDLTRVAEQNLDPAEPLIASAKQEADKSLQGGKGDPAKAAEDLKKAVRQQQAAEATLDSMLKQLEQWAGAGEVRAEARAIKDQLNKAGEQGQQATEKVESGKPADKLNPAEKSELARAADKFNQLADRAAATMSKAERMAAEKAAQAQEMQNQAAAKGQEADAAQTAADGQPKGSDGQKQAAGKAEKMRAEANAQKADADKAKAEADALRNAVEKSGGQELVNDLRNAGAELQQNNPAQSADAQKSAAKRLEQLAQSLAEQQPESGDQLKKKKQLADEVDKLAEQQDELQKKVKQAEKIEDPKKREEELKKLANEQEQLKQKTEQAAEKLTREREFDAAQKLRDAAEKMDAAKSQLDQGMPPEQQQKEALERLDESANKLDQDRKDEQDKLGREKREQLAEQLKSLRERVKAADDEAARIQAEVLKQAGWDRAKLASLGDLEERASTVAAELKQFADKEMEPLPVFRQLTEQAATLTEQAGKRFAERKADALDAAGQAFDEQVEKVADDRTRRPLRTALRRIDHVLNSLKDDPKQQGGNKENNGQGGGDMPPGGEGGGGQEQQQTGGVPQLAQLKALRAIQAELNDRTREFAKTHPDAAKLSDADREELDELEQSQREVADLFEKIKPALEKKTGEQPDR